VSSRTESSSGKSGDPEIVIRLRGVRTAFGSTVIHQDLDLDVRRGEIIGLVGGSGTGKSVLLETILGLKTPDGGSVEVLGCDIHDPVRRGTIVDRIGVMFQNGALFSSLTVRENVEAPLLEHTDFSRSFICGLAELKIRLSGLADDAGPKKPSELSGGMRKRAGVARAIALDPELLFLDEPTAGLDPIGAEEFDTLIRGLRDALGLTVFMVTHDLDSLYANCDRVAVLADRKVAAIDTLDVLEKSDHPWIKSYFSGPRGRAVQRKNK